MLTFLDTIAKVSRSRALGALLVVLGSGLWMGCGNREEAAPEVAEPSEEPWIATYDNPDDPLVAFDPELLTDSTKRLGHIALLPFDDKMPDITAPLRGPLNYMVELRLAIECSSEEAAKEIESRQLDMTEIIQEFLAQQEPRFVHSLEGKLWLKDALVAKMRAAMHGPQAIKQIYYQEFRIVPYWPEPTPSPAADGAAPETANAASSPTTPAPPDSTTSSLPSDASETNLHGGY